MIAVGLLSLAIWVVLLFGRGMFWLVGAIEYVHGATKAAGVTVNV